MLSVSTIVSGGFRLVRERPLAVAVWAIVYLAATVAMTLAMRPVTEMQVAAMGGDPQAELAGFMSMMGRMLLIQLIFMVIFLILFTASQRAVLRPEQDGFAFIRLGMDELRIVGLALLLTILFYLGMVVLALVVGLTIGAVAVAMGPEALPALVIVQMLVIFAFLIWCQVRLSLVFPLTLLRRKIVIGESWRLTSGRFWTLFGGYLVIALILLATGLAISAITSGSYLAELMRNGITLESLQAASQNQMVRQLDGIDAMTVIGWVLGALFGTLTVALFGGAIATAVGELVLDEEGIARTFA